MLKICAKSEGIFKREYRKQLLASICITIIPFAHGFGMGWFSVILAKLQSPLETALDFVITVNEGSWMGGFASLGGGCGNIIFGILADLVGRKASLYFLAIPYAISWVLVYFAKSVEYLYVGRFLAGISGGGSYVMVPIFIGEIADPKIRGRLTSFFSLTLNSGIFIGYIVTARLPYHFIPVLGVALPAIFFLSQLFFPETPVFLIQRGLDERAKKSFKFYRNFQSITKESIEEFQIEFDNLKCAVTASHNINMNVTWRDFCNKRAAIAFANSLVLMMLNIFCGAYAILYYTSNIFIQARADLDPDTNTIIVGLVQVTGVCAATILVDKFGRKPLLMFSCGATCVGLTIFGIYGYMLQNTTVDVSGLSSWLPLVNVCLVLFVVNAGLIPIPFVLLVELMPPKIRAKASAICLVLFNIFGFILMKLFPVALEDFGLALPMWSFALLDLFGLVYISLFIKETKGMSLNKVDP
ncbi:facilitated trehalose transporter Tret1-like isoform X2 [Eurosta solidaginis]|uniref:facilitated trehalose transporter Tret1-like isoform X2 n=1 Tax=Eurosta solidaginis TaxID=178769 RepID=UPI0035306772